MDKANILIATTNQGKYKEITSYFSSLDFCTFVSLKDVDPILPPEETGKTIEANALLKAKYYAEKTGYLTLADDSGLFIDALDGWPGVDTALTGETDEERLSVVMEKAKTIPKEKRQAHFASCIIIYDPHARTWFSAYKKSEGELLTEPVPERIIHLPFDSIFVDIKTRKINAHLTAEEKNQGSHRGQALESIKQYLYQKYAVRCVTVPCAIICHKGKILMSLRNDPEMPEYHNKWEFPGGSIDAGETIHETVIRETKEEVGLDVDVVSVLPYIHIEEVYKSHRGVTFRLAIIAFLCRVVGGVVHPCDDEVLEARWFAPDEVLEYNLIGTNSELYKKNLVEIKRYLSI